MRRKFSEKYGYKEIRDSLQINSIDDRLKNRIWIIIEKVIINISKRKDRYYERYYFTEQKEYDYIARLYEEYFAFNYLPNTEIQGLRNDIYEIFFKFNWYEIYDFLEVLVDFNPNNNASDAIKVALNKVFEEEMSAYRFIDDCIAPIVDEVEIQEIEDVFNSQYDSVKGHLSKALEHLSDRENPDYQNSIKESITAVESIAQIITDTKKDLGSCIKLMNIDIQKQFIKSLSGLYTWTCQEDGMRHAHNAGEELKTGFDEAKFMLVSSASFINYLISKNEQSKR